ncbi:site-2 protease family protein [archaeon]|nr:site-2 protease family protein [archaeon]
MNWDMISLGIFYVILIALFLIYRKKFSVQGLFVLYRTRFGLKLMEKLSRIKILDYLSIAAMIMGLAGMIFIFFFLAKESLKLLTIPGTQPALAPVLPGIEISGAPSLSFWHWIIVILIAATIHEFSHGLLARRFAVRIKSSGFAFFGPIIAAFVEPDEAQLTKIRKRKQIAIFSMGPFANIVFGLLVFLILSLGMHLASFQADGIIVNKVMEGYPMEHTGVQTPFIISKINGIEIRDFEDFINATEGIKPGSIINIETQPLQASSLKTAYSIITTANPQNASKAFIGITDLELKIASSRFGDISNLLPLVRWIELLFIWLFIINVGIGLFNLLPLGPLDGGRMFYVLMLYFTKSEAKAKRVLSVVSMLCLLFILINLLPWINKLIVWLAGLV